MNSRKNTRLRELVGIVAGWAAGTPDIKTVWIFGSRAKGTARPGSDLDIAYEIDEPCLPEGVSDWLAFHVARKGEWEDELKEILPVRFDLEVWHGPEDTPSVHGSLNEAQILCYSKSAGYLAIS